MMEDIRSEAASTIPAADGPCLSASRHTRRSDEQKARLMHRLTRIEGQVRGLENMLEKDAYCNDILVQSSAILAALKAFDRELLRAHLHHCVAQDIREGREETLDELADTLGKLM